MENTYAYEIPEITIEDMFEAYADMHNTSIPYTRFQYSEGEITGFDLFDAYLRYNGITGFSRYFATAARICFAEEWT